MSRGKANTKHLTERSLEIAAVAESGHVNQLAVLLQSGFHHGKAGSSQAEKMLAASTLLDTFAGDNGNLIRLTHELATSYSPSAREVACVLLQELILQDMSLQNLLLTLATDDDWEVREWSAPVFTVILATDFPAGVPQIRQLLQHPHESVLRQIALAIKQTAQKRIPNSIAMLLELTDALMAQESEYVRKNLGPFCIGDGLLRIYPSETLEALRKWAQREEWAARWNVAMAFSGAEGARHIREASEILSYLAQDPHKKVQSAVKKAARNLSKRTPEATHFATLF